MNKPTLYMETTIPSYLLAGPSRNKIASVRQEITRAWWEQDATKYSVYISDVVIREAGKGDRKASDKRLTFLQAFPLLDTLPEIESVIVRYIKEKVVPFGSAEDAAHLAFASVHQIQYLCTWNFKHLANVMALRRLREVNDKLGLFTPQVCTPEQLMGE